MAEERPTVTSIEAADLLGVSKTTVTRLVNRGELEGYQLTPASNSPFRIYKDSVEALIERRQRPFKPG